MGADAFSRIKGKQRHSHAGTLGQGEADDLALLVSHLLFQRQRLRTVQILDELFHLFSSNFFDHCTVICSSLNAGPPPTACSVPAGTAIQSPAPSRWQAPLTRNGISPSKT